MLPIRRRKRPPALFALGCLLATSHCASPKAPGLTIPESELEPLLDVLAISAAASLRDPSQTFETEIREMMEGVAGRLMPREASIECDEQAHAIMDLAGNSDPSGHTPEELEIYRDAFVECLTTRGATAVLIPEFVRVSAPYNMGVAFYCDGSQSMRTASESMLHDGDTTYGRGSVGAVCLDARLYRSDAVLVYSKQAPFTVLSRLDPRSVLGFSRVVWEDAIGDPELRAEAIERALRPLVDASESLRD